MIDSVACADELRRSGEFCLDCISLLPCYAHKYYKSIPRYSGRLVQLLCGNHASSHRDDLLPN